MIFRERRRFQIAYFLMGGFQLAVALPAARAFGKNVVMKFSGSNTIAPLTKSGLGWLELRFLRRWADRVLVLNPSMFDEAAAAGLASSQLEWMPNPVDTKHFTPLADADRGELQRAHGYGPGTLIVLFVGRLAPEKELPSLIHAFSRMRRQQADARLVLVGAGPMLGELQQLAGSLGVSEAVRFTGAVAPEDVRQWMQLADIFALVSSLEGLPCALIEAMSTGLPAVVSDISANRQLISDRVHGLLAPYGDAEKIACALLRLASDAELRRALGSAARGRIIESYSNEKVIARYETLFDSLPDKSKAEAA